MAVERMEMLNLVAPIEKINEISRDIVLLENIHIVNALNEINESNFTLCVLEENIDELVDMCIIKPYKEEIDLKEVSQKIKSLMEYLNIEKKVDKKILADDYKFDDSIQYINKIFEEINNIQKQKATYLKELNVLKELDKHIAFIKEIDIDLSKLDQLNFFNYKIGVLSKENYKKLKRNYENISAIVLHIGSDKEGEVYLVISPKELELETDRILRSLNFHGLNIPKKYLGTPRNIIREAEKRIKEIDKELIELNTKLDYLKNKYKEDISIYYSRLKLEEEIIKVKNETACTNSFFYLSGWVPVRDKKMIQNKFKKYGHEVLLMFKKASEVHEFITPPTKLKNFKLTKPFETLVKMYGIPSYDELDPTIFLSLTYMLLFGAMFGDVGQGFVLFLAGRFLSKKDDKKIFGRLLTRLGISSCVFGFLYGSIFGFEHIIPALLVQPIEHIDLMLGGSIAIGITFLLMSFIYSIINNLKQKNIKEGVFGRNGINGLVFYLTLLILMLNIGLGIKILSRGLCYTIIFTSIILMVIKEPLTNLLMNKRPLYHEPISSYYVESGFDIFETLLNMLSGTISFIRVGAFALNHVGLFIAFQTMAKILNNFAGSIIIFLLGNIIVICLEGLIVFIQGLRLEYYELFSKYYRGEGIEFRPVKLADN